MSTEKQIRKLFKQPLADIIWDTKYDRLSSMRLIRFFHALYVEFTESQINLRAMSMVYMTMLSIVPLLAVSFSVLKGFGVHTRMKPFLLNFFSPLGPKGEEVVNRIMEFVSNIQVGVLGAVGLVILIYIAIDIISRVEDAFNTIWKTASSRTLARRFSDYLVVLIIAPVLVSGAVAVTTSLMNTSLVQYFIEREPFGHLYFLAARFSPYLLICGAFIFLYKFFPNTKVSFTAAVAGGLVGGILWQTLGWTFTAFIVESVRYKNIYAGFAVLIFFMIWLYLNWLLILIGGAVSFLWQYTPTAASVRMRGLPELHFTERLAFSIMYLVGKNFYQSGAPTKLQDMNMNFNAPPGLVQQLLTLLKQGGLLIRSGERAEAYVPGRPMENITLADIAVTARGRMETKKEFMDISGIPEVDRVTETIERAVVDALGGETLHGLVTQADSAGDRIEEDRDEQET